MFITHKGKKTYLFNLKIKYPQGKELTNGKKPTGFEKQGFFSVMLH